MQEPSLEAQFLAILKNNGEDDLKLLGNGAQGYVRKVELGKKHFYAAKAYTNKDENKKKATYERESTVTKHILRECKNYLVCFSGSVVYNHNGVDEYWLLTEFLDGYVELYKLLFEDKHERKLDMRIYIDLIEGLKVLHDRLKVCHMDIKPDNILVNLKTNKIKYIDFGLACIEDKIPCKPGGTPAYLCPEYSKIVTFDDAKKADLWSLGSVIFTCEYLRTLLDNPDRYFGEKPDSGRDQHIKSALNRFDHLLFLKRDSYTINLKQLMNMVPANRTLDGLYEKKPSFVQRLFSRPT